MTLAELNQKVRELCAAMNTEMLEFRALEAENQRLTTALAESEARRLQEQNQHRALDNLANETIEALTRRVQRAEVNLVAAEDERGLAYHRCRDLANENSRLTAQLATAEAKGARQALTQCEIEARDWDAVFPESRIRMFRDRVYPASPEPRVTPENVVIRCDGSDEKGYITVITPDLAKQIVALAAPEGTP